MKILELFSGTESFSKVARERGHETFTLDFDKQFNADLVEDILGLDFKDIPFNPDIIWASPPCTCFSVASISTHWTGGYRQYIAKSVNAREALHIIDKTIDTIKHFKPKFFFIENPMGVLRKIPQMQQFHRKELTYCQYGDKRMKPTDIWTNCIDWQPKPKCKNGMSCHESAPRGSKTGTQGLKNSKDRSRIPRELCLEILDNCEEVKAIQARLTT